MTLGFPPLSLFHLLFYPPPLRDCRRSSTTTTDFLGAKMVFRPFYFFFVPLRGGEGK